MTEMEILQTTTDPIEMDMGDPVIEYSPVYPNPEGDPTDDLTKVQIQGNIYKVKDPEVHDWARAEEKPTYTKAEVGLGEVDNTSDMDKPVSTATQTALDNKVDKVAGKGLSTNDFTNGFKTKLDGIEAGAEVNTVNSVAGKTGNVTLDKSDVGLGNVDNTSDMNKPVSTATQTALNGKVDNSTLNYYYTKTETDTALGNKVDKVQGKGLSTNDYDDTAKGIVDGVTTALSDKVDKVEGYGLSQNDYSDAEKAKVGEIDNKLDKTETAVNSNGLVIATPITDTAPYIYRQTPVKESFKALMKKIVGASVVWNQVFDYNKTNSTSVLRSTISQNGKVYTVTENRESANTSFGVIFNNKDNIQGNHKVLVRFRFANFNVSDFTSFDCYLTKINGSASSSYIESRIMPTSNTVISNVLSVSDETNRFIIRAYTASRTGNESSFTVDNVNIIDLTAMFGTTIADYVYTLETAEAGTGIAWLQSYGFFTEDYYAYKQNKLESGCVSAKKIVGFNQWDEDWEVGSISGTDGTNTTGADRLRSINFVKVISGKTYYFRSQRTVNQYFYLRLYDSNKAYIANDSIAINNTYTIPSNVAYIRFTFVANTVGTYYNDICVNISDTAKNGTYEPYTETTYPISPITLRGLFKLSTDKLTVDGDEYNADGSVTRKYAISTYSKTSLPTTKDSLDRWIFSTSFYDYIEVARGKYHNAGVLYPTVCDNCDFCLESQATSGLISYEIYGHTNYCEWRIRIPDTYTAEQALALAQKMTLLYPIEPTTEQTTPFTETEIVGSTEEFIDYEVAQDNRDVAIPVGTETDYYQEMKLPSLPTTSGNHNLIYNPSTGFGWS